MKNPVLLAIIGAPHGIKGEVRVKSFTEEPAGFAEYGALFDEKGKDYKVVSVRPAKSVMIARFENISSREAAEALKGTKLFVEREKLGEPEDKDEFFLADLIGLEAVDENNKPYGHIKAVEDYGAGDIIEIRLKDGKSELFAFTKEIFPKIDVASGKITIQPPEIVSERDEKNDGKQKV